MTYPSVCIIGAGCSGFTTAKRLQDYGIPFEIFEASDDIGGNWYYNNPNGMSACYKSLHIDTSKWRLAFEDFPVPADWPDYPHHAQLLRYFHDYVDHFDLRRHIRFNTRVEKAVRRAEGGWDITLSTGETKQFDALAVCNGHHWAARIPDYPGSFDGPQIHSHNYRSPFEPIDCVGKRVLVVGMGNSAMDIASELSQRPIAEKLFVSARRGVWVFPKYYKGQPLDKNPAPAWMPKWLRQKLGETMIKNLVGRMSDYGLPEPEISPFESHGTVSGEFLLRAGSGDITMKPGIEQLDGDGVVFNDGSRERLDAIIWATGYDIKFPFFEDPGLQADADNRPPPLFKRIMKPGVPDLFYMGLAQPLPTLVNFAEQQSKLVAAYLAGKYLPPDDSEMHRVIAADEDYYTGQYYAARRHTIQLDFDHYCRALKKELAKGAKRAAARGHTLPAAGKGHGTRMTAGFLLFGMAQALVPGATPPPAADTQLVLLGENSGGRQILVDPTSLKIMPPLVGMRSFPTTQVFVEMRGPGTKGSVERVRYSFHCRARSSAALHYFRSVSGRKSHDWRGADVSFRYQPVASGTLVGMAMTYACSGGKLPVRPPNPAAVPESEPKDDEGA